MSSDHHSLAYDVYESEGGGGGGEMRIGLTCMRVRGGMGGEGGGERVFRG